MAKKKKKLPITELVPIEEDYTDLIADANPFFYSGIAEKLKDVKLPTVVDAKKRLFLDTYLEKRGMLYVTLRAIGMGSTTFYQWMREDVSFALEVEEIREFVVDFLESKLLERVSDGDTIATIFALKCRARHRGYQEQPLQQVNIQIPMINKMVSSDWKKIIAEAEKIE